MLSPYPVTTQIPSIFFRPPRFSRIQSVLTDKALTFRIAAMAAEFTVSFVLPFSICEIAALSSLFPHISIII